MHPTALGTGSRVLNAYSLVNSQGVYEGQRAAAPDQRVFILTRSGFAGQQRYAAATWSGDITSTWTAMRQQIAAGLGFSLSGHPVLDDGHRRLLRARPLLARRTRCPRTSRSGASSTPAGSSSGPSCRCPRPRRGAEARDVGDGRRVAPRLPGASSSSTACATGCCPTSTRSRARSPTRPGRSCARSSWTSATDAAARRVADQFLFGPAFLVSPVTTYKARSRSVYLPAGRPGTTSGRARPSRAGRRSTRPPPTTRCRSTCARARSCPSAPSSSGRARSRPTRSRSSSTPVPTGPSPSTRTTGSPTATRRAPSPASRSAGTTRRGRSPSGSARARSRGCSRTRTFEVVLVGKAKPVGFSFEPKADRTVALRRRRRRGAARVSVLA